MDPITVGLLVAVGAGGAAAVARWWKKKTQVATERAPRQESRKDSDVRVGDVLMHLGEEYWLSGELSLIREGTPAMRLFPAPEKGRERWVAVPRGEDSVFVMREEHTLAAMGWPGVEMPLEGLVLRAVEQGACAVSPSGEVPATWEGVGRYAVLRAAETVAVVVEQGTQRLALVGKVVPRRLVERLG